MSKNTNKQWKDD